MGEVTAYPPGTPAWVDLSTSDPKGAREFYRALFGWELDIGPDETGNYTMCLVGGAPVAGLNGQPTRYGMYALLTDPHGGVFAVMASDPQP